MDASFCTEATTFFELFFGGFWFSSAMATNYGVVLDICGHFFDLTKLKKKSWTLYQNWKLFSVLVILCYAWLQLETQVGVVELMPSVWGHATHVETSPSKSSKSCTDTLSMLFISSTNIIVMPWWLGHKLLNYFLICWNFEKVVRDVKVWSVVVLTRDTK